MGKPGHRAREAEAPRRRRLIALSQTRLHVATDTAGRTGFSHAGSAFEEDGLPISVFDLDEAKGIKEVSLYVDGVS